MVEHVGVEGKTALGKAAQEVPGVLGAVDELDGHRMMGHHVVIRRRRSEGQPAPDQVQGRPQGRWLACRHRNRRQAQASLDRVRRVTVTVITARVLREVSS